MVQRTAVWAQSKLLCAIALIRAFAPLVRTLTRDNERKFESGISVVPVTLVRSAGEGRRYPNVVPGILFIGRGCKSLVKR